MSTRRKTKLTIPIHSKDFVVLKRSEKGWLLTAGPGFKSGDSVQWRDHKLVLRYVVGIGDIPNQRTEHLWYASGATDNTFTEEIVECPKMTKRVRSLSKTLRDCARKAA